MSCRSVQTLRRAALAAGLLCALLAAGPARAQTEALVSVSPEYQLAYLGDECFPPDLLEALSVTDEGFLAPGMCWQTIDNAAGTVSLVHTQMNPAEPVSGSGALFTVIFRADVEGLDAALSLSSVTLSDRDGVVIPGGTRDGLVRLGDYQVFLPAAFR